MSSVTTVISNGIKSSAFVLEPATDKVVLNGKDASKDGGSPKSVLQSSESTFDKLKEESGAEKVTEEPKTEETKTEEKKKAGRHAGVGHKTILQSEALNTVRTIWQFQVLVG
jgi:hypothetical protein